jgi:ornithine cyclodeaminase
VSTVPEGQNHSQSSDRDGSVQGGLQQLLPIPELVDAITQAFAVPIEAPMRTSIELPGGASLLMMPAWQDNGPGGVKIVLVQPNARPSIASTYLLFDWKGGRIDAVLDGAELTPRRTAAASALAMSHLARPNATRLLVVGTGVLVPHLVEAHCAYRPIQDVAIWGRNQEKAEKTVQMLIAAGFPARPAVNLDAAVAHADIISCATLARSPFLKGAELPEGVHVDLVGAFKPDMAEADPACFARASIYVDDREAALHEAGDVIQAIAAGAMTPMDIRADLAELARASGSLRVDEREITLFKSSGLPIEDLAAARLVMINRK